jgi:hypothetical protein
MTNAFDLAPMSSIADFISLTTKYYSALAFPGHQAA